MPIKAEDVGLYGAPIAFQTKGQVSVRSGPCSSKSLHASKIPLDGRYYICAGTVIFKNGMRFQAHFEINTHTFDFLERQSVRLFLEKERTWYKPDEPELYDALGINIDDALPYKWLPDIPLDYSNPGPYPMKWPE